LKNRKVLILEWKNDGVMGDNSGDDDTDFKIVLVFYIIAYYMCLCRGLEVVCTHTETCESLQYRNVTRLEAKMTPSRPPSSWPHST